MTINTKGRSAVETFIAYHRGDNTQCAGSIRDRLLVAAGRNAAFWDGENLYLGKTSVAIQTGASLPLQRPEWMLIQQKPNSDHLMQLRATANRWFRYQKRMLLSRFNERSVAVPCRVFEW